VALSGAVLIDRKNRKSAFGALEQAGRDMKRRGVSHSEFANLLCVPRTAQFGLITRSLYGYSLRARVLNPLNHLYYRLKRALST
jgi:hypothetical protein